MKQPEWPFETLKDMMRWVNHAPESAMISVADVRWMFDQIAASRPTLTLEHPTDTAATDAPAITLEV